MTPTGKQGETGRRAKIAAAIASFRFLPLLIRNAPKMINDPKGMLNAYAAKITRRKTLSSPLSNSGDPPVKPAIWSMFGTVIRAPKASSNIPTIIKPVAGVFSLSCTDLSISESIANSAADWAD